MKTVKASIIIITKNQKQFMEKTLPIIFQQTLKDFEVIIGDSGSTDGALEVMKKYPVKIVQITAENFNYARAFNTGAKEAKGEILVRLSGDCVPANKDWLKNLIEPFGNPKIGATFGPYLYTDSPGEGLRQWWPKERIPEKPFIYTGKPWPFSGIETSLFGYKRARRFDVFALAGGNCAIRQNLWEKRPFNQNLSAAEDMEYAWFLHTINYDIAFQPNAPVKHSHPNKPEQSFWGIIFSERWVIESTFEFSKYWLKRILFINPYRHLQYEAR